MQPYLYRAVYENYLLEETRHNDLISEKNKNTRMYLNYVEHLLISTSTVTGCFSIPAFASLVCVAVDITGSAVGIKLCTTMQELKSLSQF